MPTAWIGLGSNVGDRQAMLETALATLQEPGQIDLRAVSSAWETSPVGPIDQGPFLNAVAFMRTTLAPHQLLQRLLSVEEKLGRIRDQRWGPRSIDLDLLLFESEQVDAPGLQVPHPYLMLRRFVLSPLIELAPGLRHPVSGARLSDALRQLPPDEEKVSPLAPVHLPANVTRDG